MYRNKFFYLIALLLTSSFNYGQFTDVINSNRPGESQAAFSVGKTIIQAELGFYAFRENHYLINYEASGFGSDLAVRYGAFFEQLEFILNLKYQNETYTQPAPFITEKRSGLKQTTIGAKFLLYDPVKNYQEKPNLYSWNANHKFSWRQFIPAVAVYGGLNINLSKDMFTRPKDLLGINNIPPDKKTSLKGMLITQNQFGRFVLVTNILIDKFPSNESIDYVVTLTRGISPRWSGFIEGQGYNGDYYSDVVFRGGTAFLLKQNIQIDASIGTNVKDTPSLLFGGVGLAWRFDENYNEIFLRIPKEKQSKEDKKKDKAKEKAKKRLDEIEGGGEEKTKM